MTYRTEEACRAAIDRRLSYFEGMNARPEYDEARGAWYIAYDLPRYGEDAK